MKAKKKGKFKFFRVVSLSLIIIYFILRAFPDLIPFASRTILPEEVLYQDKTQTRAIVIKYEELYKAAGKGTIEYFIEEGKRTSSGKKIAELKLSGDVSTNNQKLEEINGKIKILKETQEEIEGLDGKNINSDEKISNLVRELQNNIYTGNYEGAEVLKEKVLIYEGNKTSGDKETSFIDENLKRLEEDKKKLEIEINKNMVDYYSKDAGVVSFEVDGYEEVYRYSDRSKYRFENLKDKPSKRNLLDSKETDYNEPIFKIINNFEWHMLLDASKVKDVDKFEVGHNIRVGYKDKELIGSIEAIHTEKGKVSMLVRFNTDFNEFYNKRFIDIEVIRYKHKSYKIPEKALLEKDNEKGVYIKDISGIIRFRPVIVIGSSGDSVFVRTGDENNLISLGKDDQETKTIGKFDEVIIKNLKLKEGMIMR